MSDKVLLSNIKRTPYGFHIKGTPVGCMMVVGSFFALPGAGIVLSCLGLLSVQTPAMGSGEWLGLLFLGLAFFGVGSFIAFAKDDMIVDSKRREIRQIKGFWRYQKIETYPFSTFESIEVKHEKHDEPTDNDHLYYAITIKAHNGHHVRLTRSPSLNEMLQLALMVADITGVKAYDKTLPARSEITTQYLAPSSSRDAAIIDQSQFDWRKVAFVEDSVEGSYSRLFKGDKNGVVFYKTVYPRMIIKALVITGFMYGFCFNFLGWRVDIIFKNLIDGYLNPMFFYSTEILFTTVILSFWVLFLLIMPTFMLLRVFLLPPQYAVLALGKTGLFLNDQRHEKRTLRHKGRVIPYDAVTGVEVVLAKNPKNFKFMKFENCIGLRAAGDLFEICRGLDYSQLRVIADEIRARTPRVK